MNSATALFNFFASFEPLSYFLRLSNNAGRELCLCVAADSAGICLTVCCKVCVCPCLISVFVSLVWSHVCSLVLYSCFLVSGMWFPMVVCVCHVPSCCCSCLHPSPVPNHPVCLCYWFHLCPVNSPCLVHLCLCLPRLDCSHLSLVIRSEERRVAKECR